MNLDAGQLWGDLKIIMYKYWTLQIHIGGDQLTRERFSTAKSLRRGNLSPEARFDHLGPTTFELFHLDMNFLQQVSHKHSSDTRNKHM